MLLEQAESKLTQGPVKLKNQINRAASIDTATPVETCAGSVIKSLSRFDL